MHMYIHANASCDTDIAAPGHLRVFFDDSFLSAVAVAVEEPVKATRGAKRKSVAVVEEEPIAVEEPVKATRGGRRTSVAAVVEENRPEPVANVRVTRRRVGS